jgi:hypothetical protein
MSNQKGFAALESLLIIVVVAIIGFTGWYALHAKKATDKSLTTASSSTPTSVPFVNVIQADNSVTQETPEHAAKTSDQAAILTALHNKCTGSDNYVTINSAVFDGTTNFKQDGTHAVINASACSSIVKTIDDLEGSGANNFLHKTSSGSWTIDFAGQMGASCSEVDGLGYPATIIDSCLDGTTTRAPKQ